MCTLPTELLYEIFGKVEDVSTVKSISEVCPDFKPWTRLSSDRVVEVSVQDLAKYPKLRHTTNILVRVQYHELGTLASISHLCIQVDDAPGYYTCIRRLVDLFGMCDKMDDQLWVIKVVYGDDESMVCVHNSHCLQDRSLRLVGFTHGLIYTLCSRSLYDLLREALPNVDERLGRAFAIILSRQSIPDDIDQDMLLWRIREALGDERYREPETLEWHSLHLFTIPAAPTLYTKRDGPTGKLRPDLRLKLFLPGAPGKKYAHDQS